ncbi:MAG: hypothetical protein ACPGTP_07045, partial [Bacteroidia bacterium]
IPIVSSNLSYSIDTNNRWSIGIKAFDLLDKNRNIWRYWGQNRFIQSQNMVVRQYFMATVRYKIKKPVKKKPEIKS